MSGGYKSSFLSTTDSGCTTLVIPRPRGESRASFPPLADDILIHLFLGGLTPTYKHAEHLYKSTPVTSIKECSAYSPQTTHVYPLPGPGLTGSVNRHPMKLQFAHSLNAFSSSRETLVHHITDTFCPLPLLPPKLHCEHS